MFQISAKPEWTAIPVSAMTAVGALELVGHIKQGQNVLVTAAAGKLITDMMSASILHKLCDYVVKGYIVSSKDLANFIYV